MTEPTRRRPSRPETDGPAMGDHPELETDEVEREQPARRGERLSPLLIGGIVAAILIVAIIVLLLVV